jgi:hypothetical protein
MKLLKLNHPLIIKFLIDFLINLIIYKEVLIHQTLKKDWIFHQNKLNKWKLLNNLEENFLTIIVRNICFYLKIIFLNFKNNNQLYLIKKIYFYLIFIDNEDAIDDSMMVYMSITKVKKLITEVLEPVLI